MPCQHSEDLCQDCLQKVQTSTEEKDSPPPPQPRESKYENMKRILIDSALLGSVGYVSLVGAKTLYVFLDFGNIIVKDILKTINALTR